MTSKPGCSRRAVLAMPALIGFTPKTQAPLRFWAMGREGEVVVHLYDRDVASSVTPPVPDLTGFERVSGRRG